MSIPARVSHRQVLLALGLGALSFFARAQSLEVIELRNRTADEVIPILQPLLAPNGALSGQDFTLFVRTTSANLADLRRMLAQIDRAPRQLLVSVRRATRDQVARERMAISGALSTSGAAVSATSTESNARAGAGGIAHLTVLEGNAAFIASGTSVPVVTAAVIRAGRPSGLPNKSSSKPPSAGSAGDVRNGGVFREHYWIAAQAEYSDLTSGLLVSPRVNGDRVILDISQQTEEADGGAIRSSRLDTQVAGILGEWIAVEGAGDSATNRRDDFGTRRFSTASGERQLWVKVDVQSDR